MITLYGITRSRALRCLWMLEELGIPYERNLIAQAEVKRPEYLQINPNAHIPALVDDGLVLFESLAINLYLADKYDGKAGKGLWPKAVEERGRCYQWSVWAMTELEGHALAAMRHRVVLPEAERDLDVAETAVAALQRPLGALENRLAGKPYLLGAAFSVADLNVAAVANWVERGKVPLDAFPQAADWLKRCLERPAFKKAVKL
jgi:glutathione S-transferase